MNDYGISLYLGTGYEYNRYIIKKAYKYNAKYAFTSLNIPEEKSADYKNEIKSLLKLCKQNCLNLIIDVEPKILEKLSFKTLEELKLAGITHLRLDYGFSNEDIINLSKEFNIVFNASTLLEKDLLELIKCGADFTKFYACHNFYPKELTGLSLKKVAKLNRKYKDLGLKTIAFVAGDKILRGPIYSGLPTVEEHRQGYMLLNVLQLIKDAYTDICIVGDVDIKDESFKSLMELSNGYISLHADIIDNYSFVKDIIHHDRPDSSEYVIRSQESRIYTSQGKRFNVEPTKERKKGSISISNCNYLRYSGELEIARKDLPIENRINIIGTVKNKDIEYLNYITDGMGFKFI